MLDYLKDKGVINMALEEEQTKKINNLIESYITQQFLEYLENLNKLEELLTVDPRAFCKEIAMFNFKNDTDIHPAEAEYLISKGWNPELF